jgi:hypothetical protein
MNQKRKWGIFEDTNKLQASLKEQSSV